MGELSSTLGRREWRVQRVPLGTEGTRRGALLGSGKGSQGHAGLGHS